MKVCTYCGSPADDEVKVGSQKYPVCFGCTDELDRDLRSAEMEREEDEPEPFVPWRGWR